MRYKRLLAFSVCLTAQAVYADEMDLNKAKWICPSSVTVHGTEHKLESLAIFDGPPEQLASLVAEPRKGAQYRRLESRNIYMVCRYKDLSEGYVIHAKNATFCGTRRSKDSLLQGACWDTPSP
ncbi:MAG: hypothetical protein FWH56_10875 [Betaproteobacteria bacterium]|nr:hypothetical protein [Betaproteobacteria bacterium]